MKNVFSPQESFLLPDGTYLSHITQDTTLPAGFTQNVSLALGRIPPHSQSLIHFHPCVTQLTFVLAGNLTVRMRGFNEKDFYELTAKQNDSIMTETQTFFQLINQTDELISVLYLVNPGFLLEFDSNGEVIYNDAIIVGDNWQELNDVIEAIDVKAHANERKKYSTLQ